MKSIVRILAVVLLMSLKINAGDNLQLSQKLVNKMVANINRQFWKEDHWEFAGKRDKKTRWAHTSTALVWCAWKAKLAKGAQADDCIKQIESHVNWLMKNHWNQKQKYFTPGYAYLVNASIGFSFGATYELVGARLSDKTQADMLRAMKGIAEFLPKYTTAKDNTLKGTVANNQECHAASGLAAIAKVLKSEKVRKSALEKIRIVLDRTDDCFWMESGIDCGYQSVGESPLAEAIDFTWDELDDNEKRKISDLTMKAVVCRGFSLENGRSDSWVRDDDWSQYSAYLNRVENPFVTHDVLYRMRWLVKNKPSVWWMLDPTAVSLANGFLKYNDKISDSNSVTHDISWGGLARQLIFTKPLSDHMAGYERAHLASDKGVVAVFGNTQLAPAGKLRHKFYTQEKPLNTNPGALRYLCKDSQIFVWADDNEGLPGVMYDKQVIAPQLFSRSLRAGFASSEYQVSQVFPGYKKRSPQIISQKYIAVGSMLVAIFESGSTLQGYSYSLSVPLKKIKVANDKYPVTSITQPDLQKKGRERQLSIISVNASSSSKIGKKVKPYLKKVKNCNVPQELSVANFKFDDCQRSILVFVPDCSALKAARVAKSIELMEDGGSLSIKFSCDKREYVITSGGDNNNLSDFSNGDIYAEKMNNDFCNVFFYDDAGLVGFSVKAKKLKYKGEAIFSAADSSYISLLNNKSNTFIKAVGDDIELQGFEGKAIDLVSGKTSTSPAQIKKAARLWINNHNSK